MGPLPDFAPSERGGTGTLVEAPPARRRRGGAGGAPPAGGDGDGGGGGGDGDGRDRGDPGEPPGSEHAEFGLRLALVGITSLFLIFLAAYVMLRRRAEVWPPAGAPGAPLGLWFSTLLLAASSLAMTRARGAGVARTGAASVARWLGTGVACGTAFLVAQVAIWARLATSGLLPSTNGYGSIFYALTGLHGAHVLVGLAYMALVLARARAGRVRAQQVRLCAIYWHYMTFVWLVIFCLLWVPGGDAS